MALPTASQNKGSDSLDARWLERAQQAANRNMLNPPPPPYNYLTTALVESHISITSLKQVQQKINTDNHSGGLEGSLAHLFGAFVRRETPS